MLKIQRKESWFRPYFVEASGTTYSLDNIKFFSPLSQNLMCSSGSGWLSNTLNNDISFIELPVDKLKRKQKVSFSVNEPYVISLGKESNYDQYPKAILYIPVNMLNIHFKEQIIAYGNNIYDVYTGDYDILIKNHAGKLDTELDTIATKMREKLDSIDTYRMTSSYATLSELEQIVKTCENLTLLANEAVDEFQKLQIIKADFMKQNQ